MEKRNIIKVAGKDYSVGEARKLMRILRKKEEACYSKLSKIKDRIKILERFINETDGKKITLRQWMKSIGLDYTDFFESIGYYTPLNQSVSNDAENDILQYSKGMTLNKKIDAYVPNRHVVPKDIHNTIVKPKLGMTYNPALSLYFPTTVYDTELFAQAEGEGESVMDVAGCYTKKDIGKFSSFNDDSKELCYGLIDKYEEEFDNVEGELDTVYTLQDDIESNFSNADDSKAGKNFFCRAGCGTKHPFNKGKRKKCQEECDKKFPPSDKQEDRRQDRDDRKQAREDKRAGKKDCKAKRKSGEISAKEYRECVKNERKEKRAKVKEAGGNFFVRLGRGVAKIFPLTLATRGGVIVLAGMNAFGFSTRISPAILPEAEAKKLFKPEAIKQSKVAWGKISKAWINIGGNKDKLKKAILKGYNKKASKVSKKSSANGFTEITYDGNYSNLDPATAGLIATGLTTLTTLIGILNKNKVPKDPYASGEAPASWDESKGAVDEVPPPDPNAPQIDPKTGDWIDPTTGKRIDPLTGEFVDELFGINKYLFFGIVAVSIVGLGILVKKKLIDK